MENTVSPVVTAVQSFATQVTESIDLSTVASIMGIAVAGVISIFLFRYGASFVLSKVRNALHGRI